MSLSLRDALELVGLLMLVAAVAVAAGLWPALLAGGAVAVYLSHAWDWDDEEPVEVPAESEPAVVAAPIVRTRTLR